MSYEEGYALRDPIQTEEDINSGQSIRYTGEEWISRTDEHVLGRGEWTALTLEDAKQMAIDFAKGVN